MIGIVFCAIDTIIGTDVGRWAINLIDVYEPQVESQPTSRVRYIRVPPAYANSLLTE